MWAAGRAKKGEGEMRNKSQETESEPGGSRDYREGLEELRARLSAQALDIGSRELGAEELGSMLEAAWPRLAGYRGESKRGSRLKIMIPPEKRLSAMADGLLWRLEGSSAEAVLILGEGGWVLESARSSAGSYLVDSSDPTPIRARAKLTSAAALEFERSMMEGPRAGSKLTEWMKAGLMAVDEPLVNDELPEAGAGRGWAARGGNALWLTAASGQGGWLALELLALGADPNVKGPHGWAPLDALILGQCGSGFGARGVALALLGAGADPLRVSVEALAALESESPAGDLIMAARARAERDEVALATGAGGRGAARAKL